MVDLVFDWRLGREKPLFRYLSFLLKPVFKANHRWAMAKGQEALLRELERRRDVGSCIRNAADNLKNRDSEAPIHEQIGE